MKLLLEVRDRGIALDMNRNELSRKDKEGSKKKEIKNFRNRKREIKIEEKDNEIEKLKTRNRKVREMVLPKSLQEQTRYKKEKLKEQISPLI